MAVDGLGESSGKMRPPPKPAGMYAVEVTAANDQRASKGGHTMIEFTYKIIGLPPDVDFQGKNPLGRTAFETIYIPTDRTLEWRKRNVDKYRNRVNAAGLDVENDKIVGGIAAFVGKRFAVAFQIRDGQDGEPQQDYGRAVPLSESPFAKAAAAKKHKG